MALLVAGLGLLFCSGIYLRRYGPDIYAWIALICGLLVTLYAMSTIGV